MLMYSKYMWSVYLETMMIWLVFQAVHGDPSLEKKHKAYLEACAQFQPVFRFFFLEKYLEPAQWYERRLAYTKSVATNSIGEAKQ